MHVCLLVSSILIECVQFLQQMQNESPDFCCCRQQEKLSSISNTSDIFYYLYSKINFVSINFANNNNRNKLTNKTKTTTTKLAYSRVMYFHDYLLISTCKKIIFIAIIFKRAYLIKILLFLLYLLNCWSVCNQAWFDSTAS